MVNRVVVEVSTVDDYCAVNGVDALDILKTDTQGWDLEVLRGAQRMISKNAIHLVFTEMNFVELYEGMVPFDAYYGYLREQGFALLSFYPICYLKNRAAWMDAVFVNENYMGHTAVNPLQR